MSRNVMLVLGVIGALLLVCLCGAIATFGALGSLGVAIAREVESNPARVAAAASRIADFQLPPGYQSEVTMDFGGFQFVSYAPGDGRSHIMFVQAPGSANLDQAVLDQYLQQAAQSRGYDRRTHSQIVGSTQVTIRNQVVTLVITEGTNSDRQDYRSVTGIFQGKGGPALVSIEEPISRWNQTQVDAFIGSIR